MRDLSRFQIRLVDKRAAIVAGLAGLLATGGLLCAASATLPTPELAAPVLQPTCCLERCAPLDRLPTPAQLRSVRAWQLLAWELEQPQDRYPMPAPADRIDRLLADDALAELQGLLNEERDQVARDWLERVLSERDWSAVETALPAPERDPAREEARQQALLAAEAEVSVLARLEARLQRAHDRRLSLQVERLEAERDALTARLEARRQRATQLLPRALAVGLVSLVLCALAALRARGETLVISQSWLMTARGRRPAAWLRGFRLEERETLLLGHDGSSWSLPPARPSQLPELEAALRLVLHATPDALEQEQKQASRLQQELGRLRQPQR